MRQSGSRDGGLRRRVALAGLLLPLLLAMASSCGPRTDRPAPHVPTDTPRCPDACARLRELNCEEGRPLEDGTSCEDFCERTQDSGHALVPSCVVKIRRCSDMDDLDSFCAAPRG